MNKMSNEMKSICKNANSNLQCKDYSALQCIKWSEIANELKQYAPTVWMTFNILVNAEKKVKNHECVLSFIMAILLFHRNQRMSRIQHMLGLVLDNSGTTDEVK
jgi:hypothetical protein